MLWWLLSFFDVLWRSPCVLYGKPRFSIINSIEFFFGFSYWIKKLPTQKITKINNFLQNKSKLDRLKIFPIGNEVFLFEKPHQKRYQKFSHHSLCKIPACNCKSCTQVVEKNLDAAVVLGWQKSGWVSNFDYNYLCVVRHTCVRSCAHQCLVCMHMFDLCFPWFHCMIAWLNNKSTDMFCVYILSNLVYIIVLFHQKCGVWWIKNTSPYAFVVISSHFVHKKYINWTIICLVVSENPV